MLMQTKKITTLDYLSVLIKWRKAIIINGFIICLIVAAITLIVPKWYTASTTILPPSADSSDLGLSSLLSKAPLGGLGMGLGMVSEETNTFLAILNSRTVMEIVIKNFGLIERFNEKNIEDAIKTLRSRVKVKVNDEGTLTLSMKIKTPFFAGKSKEREAAGLAKDIADFFIEQLDQINRELKTNRAHNSRIFIERRYFQNLADLKKAEEDFQQFQNKYGAIALPEQVHAGITAAAELKAQIIKKEVELDVKKKYLSDSHAEVIRTRTELMTLENKYNEFRYGSNLDRGDSIEANVIDLFPPFSEVPELGIQYARLFREVKLQETLLEFILPQYEQAKIQEAKDTPTVQVLDKAVAPVKRSSPKRMLLVLAAGLISVIFFIMVAYVVVNMEYLKQTDYDRYQRIQKLLIDIKPNRWFK